MEQIEALKLAMLVDILKSDPHVTCIQLDAKSAQVWVHTDMPQRDDSESYEDYEARVGDEATSRFWCNGISNDSMMMITKLLTSADDGDIYHVYSANDCPGCEDESGFFFPEGSISADAKWTRDENGVMQDAYNTPQFYDLYEVSEDDGSEKKIYTAYGNKKDMLEACYALEKVVGNSNHIIRFKSA